MKFSSVEEIIEDSGLNIIRKRGNSLHIKGCPYCHDGKSKKPRSYIILDKYDDTAGVFFCHNCEGEGNNPSVKLSTLLSDIGRDDLSIELMLLRNPKKKDIKKKITDLDKMRNSIIDIRGISNEYKINKLD